MQSAVLPAILFTIFYLGISLHVVQAASNDPFRLGTLNATQASGSSNSSDPASILSLTSLVPRATTSSIPVMMTTTSAMISPSPEPSSTSISSVPTSIPSPPVTPPSSSSGGGSDPQPASPAIPPKPEPKSDKDEHDEIVVKKPVPGIPRPEVKPPSAPEPAPLKPNPAVVPASNNSSPSIPASPADTTNVTAPAQPQQQPPQQSSDDLKKNQPQASSDGIQPKRGSLFNSQRAQAIVPDSANPPSGAPEAFAAPSPVIHPEISSTGGAPSQMPGSDHRSSSGAPGGNYDSSSSAGSQSGPNMTLLAGIGGTVIGVAVIGGFVAARRNPKLLQSFMPRNVSTKDPKSMESLPDLETIHSIPSMLQTPLESIDDKASFVYADQETVSTYEPSVYSSMDRFASPADLIPPPLVKSHDGDDTSLLFGSPKSDGETGYLPESPRIQSVPQHYLNLIMPRLDMPLDFEINSDHGELINATLSTTTSSALRTVSYISSFTPDDLPKSTDGTRPEDQVDLRRPSFVSRRTSRFSSFWTFSRSHERPGHLPSVTESSAESLSRYMTP